MHGLTYSRRLFRRAAFADVGTLMRGSLVNQNRQRQSNDKQHTPQRANGEMSAVSKGIGRLLGR